MTSCHDADNFRDADEFIPDRWLDDDAKTTCRSTDPGTAIVVPFGVGKRQCPGRRFVEMELLLILAKVIYKKSLTIFDS